MTNATAVALKRKGGCAKSLGIGCLIVLVVLAIGGYLAYRSAKGFLSRVVDEHTERAPRPMPELRVSDDEAAMVLRRVSDFATALRENRATSPLVLSGRDVNVLIQRHPGWTNLAGRLHISIEGDHIGSQVSIPLGEIGWLLSGRYLNGGVSLRAGLAAGRLLVFVERAEVKGRAVPESIMKGLRTKNLAENAQSDPEVAATIGKLESVVVRDGYLRLDPKVAP